MVELERDAVHPIILMAPSVELVVNKHCLRATPTGAPGGLFLSGPSSTVRDGRKKRKGNKCP